MQLKNCNSRSCTQLQRGKRILYFGRAVKRGVLHTSRRSGGVLARAAQLVIAKPCEISLRTEALQCACDRGLRHGNF